ncbi:uncharacterized protein LOC114132097 [Aphis gossypii]|uniref:Uncharacterized protein n=1 Tax=Aphis gossypii TaxID=80765 RepID=A0A9P0NL00_APHGO|nr:uncharacterized protein LOC114132097 [Aphis gossypii]CAH1730947.1 unnamed protein product [Aphis gossypii]
MPVTGNNIFMLEVIVYRLTLTDQIQMRNTCPVCVCFQFPGLVELVVCEGGFCSDGRVGGGEIVMTNGKSCLFAISNADLCRVARDFRAVIGVNRRVVGEQQMRYVAQTHLEFDRTFTDIILNPNQVERFRKLKRVLPLYDNGRPNPVGSIELFVRLTSQGDLVVTHFNRAPDSNNYQYKSVPVEISTINCSERRSHDSKKICKHKTSCRNKRPKCRQDNHCGEPRRRSKVSETETTLNCEKEMRQANCVLTMLEKLKTLYTEMETTPLMNSSEFDTDKTDRGKPCMFDLNCPAARCPFRESKKANEFVGHLVNGTYPENEQTPNNLLNNREIVDDADLFVINVGLVDPCRVIAPAKYKDGCSQYFETDFSTK